MRRNCLFCTLNSRRIQFGRCQPEARNRHEKSATDYGSIGGVRVERMCGGYLPHPPAQLDDHGRHGSQRTPLTGRGTRGSIMERFDFLKGEKSWPPLPPLIVHGTRCLPIFYHRIEHYFETFVRIYDEHFSRQ